MSYILDALKKSERERKRASVPNPLTIQEPHATEKKSQSVRSYLFLLVVLTGTLLSGLWVGVWYAKKPHETPSSPHQTAEVSQKQDQLHAVPEDSDEKETKDHTSANTAPDTGKTAQAKPDLKNISKTRETPVKSEEAHLHESPTSVPDATPSISKPDEIVPPPDKNRLYSLQELPGALRQKLPDFSFSVFLYTEEPASRTVRVNGIMMKEGQYVFEGLKVEEILPDGVIFNYMNYRFRVGIP